MLKGQIVRGEFGKIVIRQKAEADLEVGELLITENAEKSAERNAGKKILLQVFNLSFASQISDQNLEMASGLKMEENSDFEFMEPWMRNYNLALAKTLVEIDAGKANVCKKLPGFFSDVREVTKEDINFLTKPANPLFFGNLRSGSKKIDFPIFLNGYKVFAHHILIAATTGRGKSNLMNCILWDSVDKDYCGILVLDPHDEYYGRTKFGLKDHPSSEKVAYYTPRDAPPGARTLRINLSQIKPSHFNGVVDWSEPQKEALAAYYRIFGDKWIEAIVSDRELESFNIATIGVIRRRILSLLDLNNVEGKVICHGIFDVQAGMTTVGNISDALEQGKTVVIDTSSFAGNVEILIGSLISTEVLNRYKRYKTTGDLDSKPVISIVLEEAPRVIGREVLEKGSNIFSTIAREGRKFKVGLTAITQLPSLIPRQILANMNTKVILGIEMAPERSAIIESASQDLSDDDRAIASLGIGEAIVTSNFASFALPIKIPLFEDFAKAGQKTEVKKDFRI